MTAPPSRTSTQLMRSTWMRASALAAIAVSALFAGSFWNESSPEQWTSTQIEELLGDSPWARPAEVKFLGDRGGSSLPGLGSPSGRGRTSRTPLPRTSPWPGAGGGIGFPYAKKAFESDVTLVWTSALPIRQALARQGVHDELRDVRAADDYIVTIDGLPLPLAPLAETPDVFRQGARLELKDGSVIHAHRVEVRPRPGAAGIELYFPRAAISEHDKPLQVRIAAGDYVLEAKFKPAEMVYRGR
ncbi:MAG: hypothetical protein KDC27_16650, partial [Acidobacteria bacterium]|nr:hypothetical protein [Acidobacteriota bacterium]